MFKSRSLIAAVTCFALVAGSASVVADPGNGNGNPEYDQGQGPGQGPGQGQGQGQGPGQGGKGGPGNQGGQGNPGNMGHQGGKGNGPGGGGGGGDRHNGPSIDRGGVVGMIGGHRDYWKPGPPLAPGVRKNLVRGKPMPPGIAKRLDRRMLGQLPHYDGYEWRQAGPDLILVAITSGIIYEVFSGAFN